MPPSYDPRRGLFFVNTRETCAAYVPVKQEIKAGLASTGGGVRRLNDRKTYGALRPSIRGPERKWEFRYPAPTLAGVMSTASGVVFAGDNEGNFTAFDAQHGKPLWHYPTGSSIWGAASMTYMLDVASTCSLRRQHVGRVCAASK